jgi:hypothetical protein
MTTTRYEYYNTGDGSNYGTADDTDYGGMGQTFIPQKRQTVEYTSLKLKKSVGATGSCYFQIKKAYNHLPKGSVIATSNVIDVSSLDLAPGSWKTVTFASQPTLEKFQEYALITTNPLGAINVGWRYKSNGGYSNGCMIYSDTDHPTWTVRTVGGDLMFEEWGSPAHSPPGPSKIMTWNEETEEWEETITGENNIITLKKLVAAANSKIWYEQ